MSAPPSPFRATVERLVADPATPDLSLRQLAVLMFARDEPKADCTVRGIAARLSVSKPAITRAVDRLYELGFADRQPDMKDRRSLFVRATPRGRLFVNRLSGEPATVAA